MISVRELCGLGRIPTHRTSATRWLERQQVQLRERTAKGGIAHAVLFEDLPSIEQIAWREQQVGTLSAGTYDDEVHRAFDGLKRGVQEKAERRAAIARFIATRHEGKVLADTVEAVQVEFGKGGTSEPSLRRIMADVEGIDPINWAPALAPKHKGRTAKAETDEAAWQWFLSLLRDAAPHWPIKTAWQRVKREAKAKDWAWPSYATINRRWLALTTREQLIIRYGREEADKRLYQPVRRDPTTIKALEWVSLDGRTLDLWADFGNGNPCRPVMIALVDCASSKVLDFLLSPSENAERTRDLIINTCQTYGTPPVRAA